ncbi:MAG: phospholipase D family protein [Sulfuricellaceae bacterium]|nr:phospholipase D family protein [Sulfuricellaceae bacterium]
MKKICNFILLGFGLGVWQLSMGFQLPAVDRQSALLQASGTIELAFTPGDQADRIIIKAIEAARKQVLVQTFSFTHKGIALALIDAHKRGIDVQLVSDRDQIERMERSQIPALANAGVLVLVDSEHDSAHNKIIIIDGQSAQAVVVTGSFNFTHAAQFRNAENLLVFRGNPQLTLAYLDNWRLHRKHAQPFETRK